MVRWIPTWVKIFMILIGPIGSYMIWLDKICRPFGMDHKRNIPFQVLLGLGIIFSSIFVIGQVAEYFWITQNMCPYCYQCPECPK